MGKALIVRPSLFYLISLAEEYGTSLMPDTNKTDQEHNRKISFDFELKSSLILVGAKAREVMKCREIVAEAKHETCRNITWGSLSAVHILE